MVEDTQPVIVEETTTVRVVPPRRQRITYFKKYGNTSRESLQNPAGSCLPELRAARVDRRARRMRLRKLRGWR